MTSFIHNNYEYMNFDSIRYHEIIQKLELIIKNQGNSDAVINNFPIQSWSLYILIAGLFGAISGYVYKLNSNGPIWQPLEALKSLILGLTAAFMGPLILYFLRSDLLKVIKTDEEGVFYLVGFSLLTSMFGQYFIEKLKGIFDKLNEQEEKIKNLIQINKSIINK